MTQNSTEDSVNPETPPTYLTFNGTDYPLDIEELRVGDTGLEQLRWATGLKTLSVSTNKELDWSWLQDIKTLETLELKLEGSALLNADLSKLMGVSSLKELSIVAQCPVGTIALPAVDSLRTCSITLFASAQTVDISLCTRLDLFFLDGVGIGELMLGEGAIHMTFGGFAPDLSALCSAHRLERLSLSVPQELSPFASLWHVTWLTLYNHGPEETRWNLFDLTGSVLERLTVNDCTAEELSLLVNMEGLKSLQISDEYVDDLSVLERLPGLETLILLIDPPGESAADWKPLIGQELRNVDQQTLSLLTPIPSEPLASFMERGGILILLRDMSRR